MPAIEVVFFKDDAGEVPVETWLRELRQRQPKAYAKCVARVLRLAEIGYEIRRPEADFLRDGIYELRVRLGHINYRILYFTISSKPLFWLMH